MTACSTRFEVEAGVVFIEGVACPEVYFGSAFNEAHSSVEECVERLTYIIGFGPVDSSGSGIVCTEEDVIDPGIGSHWDVVLCTYIKGVCGYEGYAFALVIDRY